MNTIRTGQRPAMRDICAKMDDIQTELDGLTQQEADEVVKAEEDADRLRFPLYEKRADIIDKIPNFWGRAWLNHPVLGTIVKPEEVELLLAIKYLDIDEIDNMTSFKIRIWFNRNSFFTNERVERTLRFVENKGSSFTNLKWKKGKQATFEQTDDPPTSFLQWLTSTTEPLRDTASEIIKNDLFANPVKYYLLPGTVQFNIQIPSSAASDSSEQSEELM